MVTKFNAEATINDLGLLSLKVSKEDFDRILAKHKDKAEAGRIVLTEILIKEDK